MGNQFLNNIFTFMAAIDVIPKINDPLYPNVSLTIFHHQFMKNAQQIITAVNVADNVHPLSHGDSGRGPYLIYSGYQ